MIQHYEEAIKYLEQAQQELRAVLDPQKKTYLASLTAAIMSIDMVKRRIEGLGKEDENDR